MDNRAALDIFSIGWTRVTSLLPASCIMVAVRETRAVKQKRKARREEVRSPGYPCPHKNFNKIPSELDEEPSEGMALWECDACGIQVLGTKYKHF
eukprot:g25295.t1